MRRFFSLFLLVFLILSQFQIGQIYANSLAELESEKQKSIQVLDTVEKVIDDTIDKIDAKTNNKEIETRLKQKEQEVEEYLNEVQQEISQEKSSKDIQEKVKEAKKVVVLKVVSGATQYEDVQDNIPEEISDTPKKKKDAEKVIQDSLQTSKGDYSIIVKTKYSLKKVKDIFSKFDGDTVIDLMYEEDEYKYLEVSVSKDSVFRQEMMEDIEV